MAMPELKPCPFCGGEARLVMGDFGKYQVYCTNRISCFVHPETELFTLKDMAIKAWNRRMPDEQD